MLSSIYDRDNLILNTQLLYLLTQDKKNVACKEKRINGKIKALYKEKKTWRE